MAIPIPTGVNYVATMKGAVWRLVPCEGCGAEYLYKMERSATGTGSSPLFLDNEGARSRASGKAEAELRSKLERGVDVAPCPACGRVQQNMVVKARKLHRRWMLNLGVLLAVAALLLTFAVGVINQGALQRTGEVAIPWPLFGTVIGILASAGVGLIVAQFILARRYDPNAEDQEVRKRKGQARAFLRTELEKMSKANQPPASDAIKP